VILRFWRVLTSRVDMCRCGHTLSNHHRNASGTYGPCYGAWCSCLAYWEARS